MHQAVFSVLYSALWLLVLPVLACSKRLRAGWFRRLGYGFPKGCDIWIQGASAGECRLAQNLLKELDTPDQAATILATSCTRQGLDILKGNTVKHLQLCTSFFPFDLPWLMYKLLQGMRPRAVILLETELWPGLLHSCARLQIPVFILNARMSQKSLPGYLTLAKVLRESPPTRISAIDTPDARRFQALFPAARISVCPNMKFDNALHAKLPGHRQYSLASCLAANTPFYVFGSVRQEEEELLCAAFVLLLRQEPQALIGLFPRHMSRCAFWEKHLQKHGLRGKLRSETQTPPEPGTVLIGDVFGELEEAYALAQAAFVGGSLAPLGGQNILEPLSQGVRPVTGPHLKNFAWIGPELLKQFVSIVRTPQELVQQLTQPAPQREKIRADFAQAIAKKQGSTRQGALLLKNILAAKDTASRRESGQR